MVSHSSHTNHEILTLVTQVTNLSFAIESFVTYEKRLIMMLHMKRIFPSSKILVSFIFFNMANLLQIDLWEILQKTSRKNVTKILKTPVKDKTPVKLHAWHFTSKTFLYGWSRNKWLLLNSNMALLMFDLGSCLKI